MSPPLSPGLLEHYFRHGYGRYVAILTRAFGVGHLELIEDAVQDTFLRASSAWREGVPEQPEAWLTVAAKRRALDLFRRLNATKARERRASPAEFVEQLDELFLEHEAADAQLRMLFTACHPALDPRDQIAFALKAVAGFGESEIAAALLLRPATLKKRLQRARRAIRSRGVRFEVPQGVGLGSRLARVLTVIHLIFNEGFHSMRRDALIRRELCGEAMRLAQLLLGSGLTAKPNVHALFALMCFQAARLESRVRQGGGVLDLRRQDRSAWDHQLIGAGHHHMEQAVPTELMTAYHYEAAIASEHLRAVSFELTDWAAVLGWYERLLLVDASPVHLLSMSVAAMELPDAARAAGYLDAVSETELGARRYLYHGCRAEWASRFGRKSKAREELSTAISLVTNEEERRYLNAKLSALEGSTVAR